MLVGATILYQCDSISKLLPTKHVLRDRDSEDVSSEFTCCVFGIDS